MNKRFSILELYKKSNDFLTKKGIESSKTDTEWILSKFLDVEKIDIVMTLPADPVMPRLIRGALPLKILTRPVHGVPRLERNRLMHRASFTINRS